MLLTLFCLEVFSLRSVSSRLFLMPFNFSLSSCLLQDGISDSDISYAQKITQYNKLKNQKRLSTDLQFV